VFNFCLLRQGHGFSDGLHCHVPSLYNIEQDISDYIMSKISSQLFHSKPFFVYGNSMGGAIAFNICTRHEAGEYVKGVILVSAMVKISEDMHPPKILEFLLEAAAHYFPLAPFTPVPSIADKCFKRQDMLERSRACNLVYKQKPRLGTALELMRATEDIARRMHELKVPVLIIHGEADVVTCPKHSVTLYEKCSSKDKTIRIYPDAWHSLIVGEPEPTASEIFSDIVQWVAKRC
jgi:caffeoylshikimate esterase